MWSITQDKIKALVNHAMLKTTHYRHSYKHMSSIESYEDFKSLPLLNKEDIRKNFLDLVTHGTDLEKSSLYYTSGTTGVPVCYVRSKQELSEASVCLSKERRRRNREAFGGKIVFFDRIKEPLKYQYHNNRPVSLALSLYDQNFERYSLYARAIQEFKPAIIQGYASTLYQFARFILEEDITMPAVRLLENRSEHLSEGHKKVIEQAFKSNITNIYGLSEIFPIAYECNYGEFHLCTDNVFVEVVSTETGEIVKEGEIGELILTSLNCLTMPLIRYKSGDLGKVAVKQCQCGLQRPVLELIKGRTNDFIRTSLGDLNPVLLRKIFDHFYQEQFLSVAQLQFVQKKLDEIIINVIPVREPDPEMEQELKKLVIECIPCLKNVSVQWVQSLEQNRVSGKVNTFVSFMDNSQKLVR